MKDRQYTTKELFQRFQPYFKPYWKTLVLDLFCAGLTTLCAAPDKSQPRPELSEPKALPDDTIPDW